MLSTTLQRLVFLIIGCLVSGAVCAKDVRTPLRSMASEGPDRKADASSKGLADLSLSYWSALRVSPSGGIPFRLDYAAVGAAKSVTISHVVPAGTTFNVFPNNDGWVCVPDEQPGSECTLSLGDLEDGASGTVVFSVALIYPTLPPQITAGGIAVAASIGSAQGDADPANNVDELFVPFRVGYIDTRSGSPLTTGEDGTSAQFSVEVGVAPSTTVTVEFVSSDPGEGVLDPAQVIFTPENYYIRQYVTVTGVDDGDLDGDAPYTITGVVVPNGGNFDGAEVEPVNAINVALSTGPVVVHVDSIGATGDGQLQSGERVRVPVTQLILELDEALVPESAETRANYRIVEAGSDGLLETEGCAALSGDDVSDALGDVRYFEDSYHVTLLVAQQRSLPTGKYRLIVCDTLVAISGTSLDGDADGVPGGEFTLDFEVTDTNYVLNGNFDVDLENWQFDGSPPFGIGWSRFEDVSQFSGSGLIGVDDSSGQLGYETYQCLAFVDFLAATARMRLWAEQPATLRLRLEYFETDDCGGAKLATVASSRPAPSGNGPWQLLRLEAPPLPALTLAGSTKLSVGVDGAAETALTLYVDDVATSHTLAFFEDDFESDVQQ